MPEAYWAPCCVWCTFRAPPLLRLLRVSHVYFWQKINLWTSLNHCHLIDPNWLPCTPRHVHPLGLQGDGAASSHPLLRACPPSGSGIRQCLGASAFSLASSSCSAGRSVSGSRSGPKCCRRPGCLRLRSSRRLPVMGRGHPREGPAAASPFCSPLACRGVSPVAWRHRSHHGASEPARQASLQRLVRCGRPHQSTGVNHADAPPSLACVLAADRHYHRKEATCRAHLPQGPDAAHPTRALSHLYSPLPPTVAPSPSRPLLDFDHCRQCYN
jgi:hypothetical protein